MSANRDAGDGPPRAAAPRPRRRRDRARLHRSDRPGPAPRPRAAPAAVAADDRPALRGRAPAIFVGHGSPMNALRTTRFTRTLQRWNYEIGLPRAIVVVSAHWLTPRSTRVSAASAPETIHDFGGFPAELHAMTYPAPGAPALAAARRGRARAARQRDRRRARPRPRRLDGAAPALSGGQRAGVPALDRHRPASGLSPGDRPARSPALRDDGVLVLGSGNIVHNLSATERSAGETAPRAHRLGGRLRSQQIKRALDTGDRGALVAYDQLKAARIAVPTRGSLLPAALRRRRGAIGRSAAPCLRGLPVGALSHALPALGLGTARVRVVRVPDAARAQALGFLRRGGAGLAPAGARLPRRGLLALEREAAPRAAGGPAWRRRSACASSLRCGAIAASWATLWRRKRSARFRAWCGCQPSCFERAARAHQRRVERLALDQRHAELVQLVVVLDVARARDDRQRREVLARPCARSSTLCSMSSIATHDHARLVGAGACASGRAASRRRSRRASRSGATPRSARRRGRARSA